MLLLLIVPCLFLIILPMLPKTAWRSGFIATAMIELAGALGGLHPGQSVNFSWWPSLGLNISLAVTPYNQPLIWLNGLVLLATAWTTRDPSRESVLWLTFAFIGVTLAFFSQNLILYFLGFEMAVLPFFLLVRKDGGEGRRTAAFYFLSFSALAGMLLLSAVLSLTVRHITGFGPVPISPALQQIVYTLLLVTWAVKTPLWPFHLWLPRTHGEASTPVSMYLAGVALKVAPYGLLLFSGLLPQAVHQDQGFLALWGAITLLAGTLLALAQRDLKQTVALSSIASMGYVMIALSQGTALGRQAAILVMFGHGLASPLLFWITGRVQDVIGSRQLADLPGLYHKDPGVVRWMTLAAMAYMGIPGLALFPGEFGVIVAAFKQDPATLYLIAPAILIMAATWIRILARARFGQAEPVGTTADPRSDRVGAWWLGIPLVLFGAVPAWWIHLWHWGGLS